ncbi:MAG: peptidase [Xanthomonadales bacterium]|nr:peptidase [Xanthomonadales bacterium]
MRLSSSLRVLFQSLLVSAVAVASVQGATITIVNIDGPDEGLNDPTPVAPLNSNPATTLGGQRLAVFQKAAEQWGALLTSDVEILVRAAFNPLTCSATSATLGSAGALSVVRDFPNAPQANVHYSIALANSLAGVDLAPTTEDINTQFNTSIDAGCLSGVAGWYYGLDPALDPVPADRTPLLPVVFHELAHGLGFQTFTNNATGAFFQGVPDAWTNFLADARTRTTWRAMASDADRAASAISDPNLVWIGPNVTADKERFLGFSPTLIISAPAAIAGNSPANPALFGPPVTAPGVSGEVAAALPALACDPLTNPTEISGKIALVDRGTCNFSIKVANAQAAGAIAVVVANNAATGLPGMGGADPTITIPSYGILQAAGQSIRSQLGTAPVTVTLGFNSELAGTNRGFVRMHAPAVLAPGSSVSHFTVDASPNLLMEPSLNRDIFEEVDLALALFRDIGWNDTGPPGVLMFSNGFESN